MGKQQYKFKFYHTAFGLYLEGWQSPKNCMAAYEAQRSPARVASDLKMKNVVVGLAASSTSRHTDREIESGKRQ